MGTTNQGELGAKGGDVLLSLESMEAAIMEATEAYFGEPGHNPLELPDPKAAGLELRAAIQSEDLPDDREAQLREAMGKLGPGRESDVDAKDAGLNTGYTALVEAGQAAKKVAELEVIARELRKPDGARPRAIIIAASAERRIENTDAVKERTSAARVLDLADEAQVPDNEYELARLIAGRMNGFNPQQPEFDMGYNYTIDGLPAPGGEAAKPEERGRFMCIGVIGNEIPVILLRVDREYYTQDGERKYRQLDDRGKMRLIAQYLQQGGASVQEVGLVTGAAYLPSRALAAAAVEQETGVMTRIMSYGAATLAAVKRAPDVKLSVGQLAGEARQAWVRLQEFVAQQHN